MKKTTPFNHYLAQLANRSLAGVAELGYLLLLLGECLYWLLFGHTGPQSIRLNSIVTEALNIGVYALLIVSALCGSVGIMLAIHSLGLLKKYGVESQIILALAKSMTQEFAPLIVAILVAGRSGSAITARIGSMMESQEIDALRVIGINPVRYLATPIFLGMVLIVPCITIWGDFVGILGGALYASGHLKLSLAIYFERTLDGLAAADILEGLIKSMLFASLIALISISQGFQAKGGTEGVGRATTRSVVFSLCAVIIADMVFTFFLSRI